MGEMFFWNNFHGWKGQVAGRDCRIIFPPTARPGQPWIWKPEFLDAFTQVDIALVERGFHLAYIDVSDHYGCPTALEYGDALYDIAVRQFGLSRKIGFIALSRGGLFAYNWTVRHPDRVACLYADNPVCDIKSWPAGWGEGPGSPEDWSKCLKAYKLTEAKARTFYGNPIDQINHLIAAQIPILHVIGGADEIVPVQENSDRIRAIYLAASAPYEEVVKPKGRHHPHGLDNPAKIIAFFERHL